jgi:integrase/recombinase XerD
MNRQGASIVEALEEFYSEQEYKGNRPATLLFYRKNFAHFLKDTGVAEVSAFEEGLIRRWLLAHRTLSPNSLATYDRCLRVFGGWLYRRGYVPENPMGMLPKPKGKRVEIVTFTAEEVRAMLTDAQRRNHPLRDSALLTLLLDTGLRIGEASSLQLQDVDWGLGSLMVDGKSGERSVPFGRKAKQALRRYIDRERVAASPTVREVFLSRSGTRLLPNAATHHVIKIARTANVRATKLGPHTFRHTFALEFIRAGGDAFTLQRILGHTTLDMTRKYVHLANTDLRAAHKRFAPGDRML